MVILITGKNDMSEALQKKFAEHGHRVMTAGHAEEIAVLLDGEEKLDMLVTGICHSPEEKDGDIASGPDWRRAERLYQKNAVESLAALQRAFPYLERGGLKRICYLSLLGGSINASGEKAGYGIYMSACAVNMQANLLYNRMRKLGYTFRIFGMEKEAGVGEMASAAYQYFTENRSVDPDSAKHTDENRLVMRNKDGREIPF